MSGHPQPELGSCHPLASSHLERVVFGLHKGLTIFLFFFSGWYLIKVGRFKKSGFLISLETLANLSKIGSSFPIWQSARAEKHLPMGRSALVQFLWWPDSPLAVLFYHVGPLQWYHLPWNQMVRCCALHLLITKIPFKLAKLRGSMQAHSK